MQPIVALGCGLVGEYVIHRLADDGHRVVAVDIRIPDSLIQRSEVNFSTINKETLVFMASALSKCERKENL